MLTSAGREHPPCVDCCPTAAGSYRWSSAMHRYPTWPFSPDEPHMLTVQNPSGQARKAKCQETKYCQQRCCAGHPRIETSKATAPDPARSMSRDPLKAAGAPGVPAEEGEDVLELDVSSMQKQGMNMDAGGGCSCVSMVGACHAKLLIPHSSGRWQNVCILDCLLSRQL